MKHDHISYLRVARARLDHCEVTTAQVNKHLLVRLHFHIRCEAVEQNVSTALVGDEADLGVLEILGPQHCQRGSVHSHSAVEDCVQALQLVGDRTSAATGLEQLSFRSLGHETERRLECERVQIQCGTQRQKEAAVSKKISAARIKHELNHQIKQAMSHAPIAFINHCLVLLQLPASKSGAEASSQVVHDKLVADVTNDPVHILG